MRSPATRGNETQFIDPLARRTTSIYDDAGRQTVRIDARAYRTTYTRDAIDRLTGRKYPDGSRVTFAYDSLGNRTKMHDSTGRYTSTYDVLGRAATATDPAGKRITYSYDAIGRRASMVDPDGGRFTYSYNSTGTLSVLNNPQGDRASFTYDNADRRSVKKLANGTRASYTYDAMDNLSKLYNLKSDGSVISSFDYSYNGMQYRTKCIEAGGDRVTWSYDARYRLARELRSGVNAYVHTFSYDTTENRTVKNENGNRTTYTYDVADQLVYSLDATGRTTYTFDANGNQRMTLTPSGNRTTNIWDYENRTTKVELPSAIRNTYAYNGDGLRVKSENSTETVKFVWDGQQYLKETDGSDVTTAVYTNAPGRFASLVAQIRSGTTHYYHFDAVGSTRALTDTDGNVTDAGAYDAWGNDLASSGTTETPFRFCGAYGYHSESSNLFIMALKRSYSPRTGQWLAQDPLRFVDGANRYVFARNAPVTVVDPRGTKCVPTQDGTVQTILGRGTFDLLLQAIAPGSDEACRTEWTNQEIACVEFKLSFSPTPFEFHDSPARAAKELQQGSRIFCPCCCDDVKFVQVVNDGNWRVDQTASGRGIAYGGGSINPCKIFLDANNQPKVQGAQVELEDHPGMTHPMFSSKALTAQFETCAFCSFGTGMPERLLTTGAKRSGSKVRGVTTYGCVKWGYTITPGGSLFAPAYDYELWAQIGDGPIDKTNGVTWAFRGNGWVDLSTGSHQRIRISRTVGAVHTNHPFKTTVVGASVRP